MSGRIEGLLCVRFAEGTADRARRGSGGFTALGARVPATLGGLLTANLLELDGDGVQHRVGHYAKLGAGVLRLGAGVSHEGGNIESRAYLHAHGLTGEKRNLALLLYAAVFTGLALVAAVVMLGTVDSGGIMGLTERIAVWIPVLVMALVGADELRR